MGAGDERGELAAVVAPPSPDKQRSGFLSRLPKHLPEGRDKVATVALVLSLLVSYKAYHQNEAQTYYAGD
jgi:hypothetical protein